MALTFFTRRSFLVRAAAIGGSLSLGFRIPLGLASARAGANAAEITAWIEIAPDETVIIRVARSEMGQGVTTALSMLIAEELECDWTRVKPERVTPAENLQRGGVWGAMSTGASRSISSGQQHLRIAGATAREMLIAAAAAQWLVAAPECRAANGLITHVPSGRIVTFGQIAQAAASLAPPAEVRLKEPGDWKLIGTRQKCLDVPDKVTGTALFGTDIRVPNMLYAAIRQCPVFKGTLKSVEARAASSHKGVRRIVQLPNAVAVVADSWWRANRAVEAIAVTWDDDENAQVSSADIQLSLREGLSAADADIGREDGDVAGALSGSVKCIEAEYAVPFLAHATMEPQNCTAQITHDGAEIWVPTQDPEAALVTAALTAGVPPENVVVHPTTVGGGFGRRVAIQDFVQQAVLIAKEVDQPVQLVWSREEDIRHDFYRPVAMAKLTAGFDAYGALIAWRVRICGQSIVTSMAPEMIRDDFDRQFLEGFLEDMPYAVRHYLVDYVMRDTHVPVGPWRSVNHSQNAFFRECFVDEMAHAVGADPYQFRRKLLQSQPKHLAVLDAAAQKSGWGSSLPPGIFRGIALSASHASICAQVVEASVSDTGQVRAHRVTSAIDAGYVVNPLTLERQTAGAVAFALTAALYGEIRIQRGRVQESNFHDYPMLRMGEMPLVQTIIVRGQDRWGGGGEPAVPPLAPALCNAIFAATGQRVRSLPVKNSISRKPSSGQ